jgi:hypothetical protein
LAAGVARAITEDRSSYLAAIEETAGERADLMNHLALAAWVDDFPQRTKLGVHGAHVRGLATAGGDPYLATAVIVALRAEAAPPEETAESEEEAA